MPTITNLRTWFTQTHEKTSEEKPLEKIDVVPPPTGLAVNLSLGLADVRKITEARLREHFGKGKFEMPDLQLYDDGSPLFTKIKEWELSVEEYLTLMIAFAPHLEPNFFDTIIQKMIPKESEFPDFGGVKGSTYRGLLPTGDTVLFILKGLDLSGRLAIKQHILSDENLLFKEKVLILEEPKEGEPSTSGKLMIANDYIELFTTGQHWRPHFGANFPAKLISTTMEWKDLVVSENTRMELEQIINWIEFNPQLLKDNALKSRLKHGYRVLFFGPSGTGKTLAATLLGKRIGREVYRIDLSMVISKYIGETETNLQRLFDIAENKDWILFFDEADSLFGKRTAVGSSHDRYANQEVSYLLQRIEDYGGLVILASNFKNNIDQAFTRRFNGMVSFAIPNPSERLLLWQQTFPTAIPTATDISLEEFARNYELTGATILNVIHIAAIQSLAIDKPLDKTMLIQEIRKEYNKEGKTI